MPHGVPMVLGFLPPWLRGTSRSLVDAALFCPAHDVETGGGDVEKKGKTAGPFVHD